MSRKIERHQKERKNTNEKGLKKERKVVQ